MLINSRVSLSVDVQNESMPRVVMWFSLRQVALPSFGWVGFGCHLHRSLENFSDIDQA
jgi:hypothetical protein